MFGKINLDGKTNSNLFGSKSMPQASKKVEEEQRNYKDKQKSKFIKKDKKQHDHTKGTNFIKSQEELQGAKFRILNQLLYTRPSEQAVEYFNNNKQDFQLYHQGYRHQTTKWQHRPVDQIISYLLKKEQTYKKYKIADLGCGQGFLHEALVPKGFKRVLSFDLVAVKSFIKEADISNLPLKDGSVQICVFCLSLMGTNYLAFIQEAWRVLGESGQLIISQVQSRSPSWPTFIQLIESQGFSLLNDGVRLVVKYHKNEEGQQGTRYFRTMLFRKTDKPKQMKLQFDGKWWKCQQLAGKVLVSCKYKKR